MRRRGDTDVPAGAHVRDFAGHALLHPRGARFLVQRHPRAKPHTNARKDFRIWRAEHRFPWLFAVEAFTFVMFFVLAVVVQDTTLPFFQHFGKAVDSYFLDGYDVDIDDQVDSIGERRIYTKPMFARIFNSSVYRFFGFAADFPCSYALRRATDLTLRVRTLAGDVLAFSFGSDNMSQAVAVMGEHMDFAEVQLAMYFTIEQNSFGRVLETGVMTNFFNYHGTGIILWNLGHDRSTRSAAGASLLGNFPVLLHVAIIAGLALGVALQTISLLRLYRHCVARAGDERVPPMTVFKQKLSTWEVVTLCFNVVSLVLMVVYTLSGRVLHDDVPWQMFLVAFAAFLQSMVLIRYISMISSTLIVIRMISRAITQLLQFLVGCLPFCLGFVLIGVSWFGWYSPLMSSARQAAKLLIASSYGDYLLDGYDGLTDGADKPKIIPSAYLTLWIFNGLGIWFYIVLAILHAALFKEVHIAHNEKIENEIVEDDEDPLPWLKYNYEH